MWNQQNQYQNIPNINSSFPQQRVEQGMPTNFNQLQIQNPNVQVQSYGTNIQPNYQEIMQNQPYNPMNQQFFPNFQTPAPVSNLQLNQGKAIPIQNPISSPQTGQQTNIPSNLYTRTNQEAQVTFQPISPSVNPNIYTQQNLQNQNIPYIGNQNIFENQQTFDNFQNAVQLPQQPLLNQSKQPVQSFRKKLDKLLENSFISSLNDKLWIYDMYFPLQAKDSFINAVGIAFLQHLLRPSTPQKDVQQFINQVETQQIGFQQFNFNLSNSYQEFTVQIKKLLQFRNKTSESEKIINQFLQSNILAIAFKYVISCYLQTYKQWTPQSIIQLLQLDQLDRQIIPHLSEALNNFLQIQIVIEGELSSEVAIYQHQESQNTLPLIPLLDYQSGNYYCILYTKEQTCLDGINSQGLITEDSFIPPQIRSALRKQEDQWPVLIGFPIYAKKQEKFSDLVRNQNQLIDLLSQRIKKLYESTEKFDKDLYQWQDKILNIQVMRDNKNAIILNSEQNFRQDLQSLVSENKALLQSVNMSQSSQQKQVNESNKLQQLLQIQLGQICNFQFLWQVKNVIGVATQLDVQSCQSCGKKQNSKMVLKCQHIFHKACLTQSIMQQTNNQIIGQFVYCPNCLENKKTYQLSDEEILNTVGQNKFYEAKRKYQELAAEKLNEIPLQQEFCCENCKQTKEIPDKSNIKCHLVCISCMEFAVNPQTCKFFNSVTHKCGVPLDEETKNIYKKLYICCQFQNCRQMNSTVYEQMIQLTSCKHKFHPTCISALLQNRLQFNNRQCLRVGCNHNIQEADISTILQLQTKCKCCNKTSFQGAQIIQLNCCQSQICKDCLLQQIAANNELKCIFCQRNLDTNQINKLTGINIQTQIQALEQQNLQAAQSNQEKIALQDQEYIKQLLEKEKIEKQNQKPKFDCPVCGLKYDIEINCITLGCDHKLCKECFSLYLTSLVDQGKFKTEELVCFVCNEPLEKVQWDPNMMNLEILKEGLSKQYVEKVERLRMGNMKGVIQCPNPDGCECRMMADDIKNATCPVCKYEFCCTCFKKPHNEMCNLDEALEEAQKLGMDVRKCPNCNT